MRESRAILLALAIAVGLYFVAPCALNRWLPRAREPTPPSPARQLLQCLVNELLIYETREGVLPAGEAWREFLAAAPCAEALEQLWLSTSLLTMYDNGVLSYVNDPRASLGSADPELIVLTLDYDGTRLGATASGFATVTNAVVGELRRN